MAFRGKGQDQNRLTEAREEASVDVQAMTGAWSGGGRGRGERRQAEGWLGGGLTRTGVLGCWGEGEARESPGGNFPGLGLHQYGGVLFLSHRGLEDKQVGGGTRTHFVGIV